MSSGITRTASTRSARPSGRISEDKPITGSHKKWHATGTTAVDLAFIVADFFHQLSLLQRRFAEDMDNLVLTFQERTQTFADRCSEDCSCVQRAWLALLKNCSATKQETLELSNVTENSISPQLEDIAKYRKDLLTEVMSYHNTFIKELEDARKQLSKDQDHYQTSWKKMKADDKDLMNQSTAQCYNSLNEYVLQLAGTNHTETTICNVALSRTVSDLEAIQCDIQEAIAFSLNRYARLFQAQLLEQANRLDGLIGSTKKANHLQVSQDLSVLTQIPRPESKIFEFYIVDPATDQEGVDFKNNKLVLNTMTEAGLKQRYNHLTQQIREQEMSVSASRDSLTHLRKLLESQKSTEKASAVAKILSDIHKVKNNIRSQEVFLGLHRTQLLLFPPDWFTSSNSLTNGHPSTNSSSSSAHHVLQEYNFIKTTLCFRCKTPLKGLMKQGVRCKICKVSVHHKCQENLPDCSVLAADKRKFLRRQKSSSALEIPEDTLREREREESSKPSVTVDPVYETIKCAASLSSLSHTSSESRPASSCSSSKPASELRGAVGSCKDDEDALFLAPETTSLSKSAPHRRLRMSSLDRFSALNFSSNNSSDLPNTNLLTSFHDSPSHSDERRKILQQCGKSVSLDHEKGPREDERRLIASAVAVSASPPNRGHTVSSLTASVLSPRILRRRHHHAATIPKISSSLEDELLKRYRDRILSAQTNKDANKPRQSTHQFVVLYDFEGMLRDDLTLRAGELIRVLSGRNAEWWKGEVDGRIGFFPSFCVTPIYANESVMRVNTGIRAAQEHIDGINLRQHQIVVKSGNDEGGWVKVRTALKSGYYPSNCLQTLISQQ
ncbi:uncharacterized protein [Apostichopus japonicus]|uniref:uncharacterized protein isoform X2 n=1 Tax=Stichopus japonicus TaxID=307972 RepID=UPI003AB1AC26